VQFDLSKKIVNRAGPPTTPIAIVSLPFMGTDASYFGLFITIPDDCPDFVIKMPPGSANAKLAVPIRIQTERVFDLREDLRRMDGSDLPPEESRELIRALIRFGMRGAFMSISKAGDTS
jgi:hypothetical protein